MCLETVASKEELEKWKAKKGKYVKVYKACLRPGTKWEAWAMTHFYKCGWNKDRKRRKIKDYRTPASSYPTGFHCHLTKTAARLWSCSTIIVAYVPTDSIVAMGTQGGYKTIVSRSIYMPEFPETVAEMPK